MDAVLNAFDSGQAVAQVFQAVMRYLAPGPIHLL